MQSISRRHFLKSTAASAAAASLLPSYSRVLGANENLRVAIVGFNGRGRTILNQFKGIDGVSIAALCDVDADVIARQADNFPGVFMTTDVREVLDRDDIDIVASATPNHWHALLTVWACQAGKHVYIEKPASHNVWEGGPMVAAARKYNRIVQCGMQNRSDTGLIPFYEDLHNGRFGAVKMIRGMCCKTRSSIGKRDAPLEIPGNIDYDLWLGPAANEPIFRDRLHYDWHWMWNTGNADIGNQGPHELDLYRWALNDPMTRPTNIQSFGGRFMWDDAGETPNIQVAMFDYEGIPCIHETCDIPMPHLENPSRSRAYDKDGVSIGVMITCEDAEFRGGRGGGVVLDSDGNEIEKYRGSSSDRHVRNFIDAIHNNDASILNCDIESAVVSADLAHLSNIAYRVGSTMSQGQIADTFSGHEVSQEAAERYTIYLADRGVNLNETPWTCGPKLSFDSEAMQFTGTLSGRANTLLRREYREGFEVPEEV